MSIRPKTRHLCLGAVAATAIVAATAASAQTSPPPDSPRQDAARPASPTSVVAPVRQTPANRSDAGARAAPTRQDTGAGSIGEVSEVIVTAGRANTVQQTPAAVSAFTDERRNLLGIENGRDIANLTPSMQLQGEYVAIRGVGRYNDPGAGLDPGIAVYVDGVYTSSPAYLAQPDFLTDRIEVVRGPTSIEGRNNTGGAVSVYSRRPTDDFHADLRAGYTSQEFGYFDAAVSGPIADKLKGRLAFTGSDTRDGQAKNVAGDYANPGTGDTRLYEAQLQYDPTPDLDIWFRYQMFGNNSRATYGVTGGTNLLGPYNSGVPTYANYTGALFYGLAVNPQFGINPNSNPTARDLTYVSVDDPGHANIRNDHTFTTNISWDMQWAKLKYIGGYSQYTYDSDSDADFTNRATLTSIPGTVYPNGITVPSYYTADSLQNKKWYSNELTLSSPDNQPLRWVIGGYQYYEQYKTFFSVRDPNAFWLKDPFFVNPATGGPGAPAPANPTAAFYSQETVLHSANQAVYAQLDYDLTSMIRLTGAFRYNWDQRYGFNSTRYIFDLYSIYGQYGVPQASLDVTPATSRAQTTAKFDDWSGKAGVEFHPDSTTNAYFLVARGYKSGGFNLANFFPIPTVHPEIVTDYEGGLKKTFNRQLLVDAAAYYYDYSGLQVPITLQVPGPVNPVTGIQTPITSPGLVNAQHTHSYGFELETIYSPLENLHFTLVYSWQRARFQQFTSGTAGGLIIDPATGTGYADLRGNTVPQVPENKISIIPNYVWHTPTGDLSLSATGTFTDSEYYAVFNTPNYHAPSYYNVDLRAVYQPTNSHFTVIGYVRNLTNSNQFIYHYSNTNIAALPQTIYTLAEQRAIGGEVQYRF